MKPVTWLFPMLLAVQGVVPTSLGGQAAPFENTRIGEGIYQFRWQAHNGFFVVTPAGVVAFDPISSPAAAQYAEEIKRVAPGQPLLAVVYSHDHADHATGAPVLRRSMGNEHAPIIAHELAYAKVKAAGSAELPPPEVTFRDTLVLRYGGRTIELHYLGKNHSDNMIVAYLPAERVAFAVDFVSNDRVGYRDLPDYHFPDFFTSLERLQQLDYQTIVFGHGPPGDRASVDRQIRYYTDLRNAVERAVSQGWSEDRAAQEVKLPAYEKWGSYADWFPLNVRAVYRWAASRGRPQVGSGNTQQAGGTLRVAVGSELISGFSLPVHGSRIERYQVDPGKDPRHVGWITNLMTIGDTAGRAVFRFRTDGEGPGAGGATNSYTMFTTFDRKTTALLGYSYKGSLGREVKLSLDGDRVRGTIKLPTDSVAKGVDVTLTRPGFLGSSMDIQLALLPLRPGLVIEMPVWAPGAPDVESRWYVVASKGTAKMGGKTVEAWVTEEWSADRSRKLSTLNVITIAPFMEWQEVEQPSGAKTRLTQELCEPPCGIRVGKGR